MIVLDASVVIAHLDANDAQHDRAGEVLRGAGAEVLAIHPITLAEVLVGPTRTGQQKVVLEALDLLDVEILGFGDHTAPVQLAELRATTRLKLPDCCVLHAAMEAGATIATFDLDLARAARERGLLSPVIQRF
jgi:predicted nucleic acid-binding protein